MQLQEPSRGTVMGTYISVTKHDSFHIKYVLNARVCVSHRVRNESWSGSWRSDVRAQSEDGGGGVKDKRVAKREDREDQ